MIVNFDVGLLTGTAAPGSLLFRHPEYNHRRWWRELARVSYLGGREYARPTNISIEFMEPFFTTNDQGITAIDQSNPTRLVTYHSLLFRHSREKAWEYENRIQRAHYYNFVRTIVNMLVSHAVKRSPVRKTDDPLIDEFWNSVDGEGKSIDGFMRHGLRWTQVEGIMWACVDVDPDDLTQPYAYWVSPLDILDWETDADGEIQWLKQFVYAEAPRTWDKPITSRYRFRIWSKTGVETFETDTQGAGKTLIPELTRAYDLGRVPFEPLYSLRDEEYLFPDGSPLVADLCKGANAVYNDISLLNEIKCKQTFAWLAIPDKHVDTIQMGVNTAFGYDATQTNGAHPMYLSPDPQNARVIMESIAATIEQLRTAIGIGRGRSDASMQRPSADAMELESEDKRSILGDIAAEAEDFERRLVDLVNAYRTSAPTAKTAIHYQREFDIRALQDEIDEALSFKSLPISPEILQELVNQLVRRKFSGMEQGDINKLLGTITPQMAVDSLAASAVPPPVDPNITKSDPNMSPEAKAAKKPDQPQMSQSVATAGSGSSGSAIAIGNRVTVKPGEEHMPAHVGVVGTVKIVNGTNIGIQFDGIPGVHKWYSPDELNVVE